MSEWTDAIDYDTQHAELHPGGLGMHCQQGTQDTAHGAEHKDAEGVLMRIACSVPSTFSLGVCQ